MYTVQYAVYMIIPKHWGHTVSRSFSISIESLNWWWVLGERKNVVVLSDYPAPVSPLRSRACTAYEWSEIMQMQNVPARHSVK